MPADTFPIKAGTYLRAIPLGLLAAHERFANLNHGGRSLAQLAADGGLTPAEALLIARGEPTPYAAVEGAELKLLQMVIRVQGVMGW